MFSFFIFDFSEMLISFYEGLEIMKENTENT